MKKILFAGLALFLISSVFAEKTKTYSNIIESDINNLDIKIHSEALKISENENNQIKISVSTNNKKLVPNIYEENGKLSVTASKKRYSFGDYCSIELSVPKNYQFKSVYIQRSSGSMNAESLFAKNIIIKSSSGSLIANTICADNELNICSSSGSIRIESVEADDLTINSSSGSIKIAKINVADGSITSTSGSIKCESLDSDTLEIKSTSGSVDISDISTDCFSMNSTSGSIKLQFYEVPIKASHIKSTSGSVKLEFQEKEGFCLDYQTTSGSLHDNITGENINNCKEFHKTYFNGKTNIFVTTTSGSLSIY